MAGTLVKVRFKIAWQNYRVGDEITPNGTLRDWLLNQGYVDLAGGSREAETPGRPAKLAAKAAKKLAEGSDRIADTAKSLFGAR